VRGFFDNALLRCFVAATATGRHLGLDAKAVCGLMKFRFAISNKRVHGQTCRAEQCRPFVTISKPPDALDTLALDTLCGLVGNTVPEALVENISFGIEDRYETMKSGSAELRSY